MMNFRTMYGVYPTENDISDPTAIFKSRRLASVFLAELAGDPDFDGCDYVVVPITIDVGGIKEHYHLVRGEG